MILLACALSFLAASLLVVSLLVSRDPTARRRIEKELWKKNVAKIRSTLLRDDTLSRFGLLQRFLTSMRVATNLHRLIEQADLRIRVGTLIMMMALLGVLGFLVGHAAQLGMVLPPIIGLLTGSLPHSYIVLCRNRRFRRFESQFPDAVDLMSRAVRAGHAFSTAIKIVADEMPDPVGKEFRRVFEEQNLGLPLRTVLMNLADRIRIVDLKLFVVAVLVQTQSGGNLSEIFDKIAYTIRERFRILRQLRVHTAQAKMTGLILISLPPVVGTFIYALNYEYMRIMFTEVWGLRIMACALLMQIVGFLWIRKIVNIEV